MILEERMKYTRVKAVTCALTVSAMLFSTAALQAGATGVSYELPAAGVGLALEEGSSLGSVQEAADQSEKAEQTVQAAQESSDLTSADMESGITGVGESSIDAQVDNHIQEQQTEAAIANGIGVASVLDAAGTSETTASVSNALPAAVGNTASGGQAVLPADTLAVGEAAELPKTIVEPVDLKETQTAKTETEEKPAQDEAAQADDNNKKDKESEQETESGKESESKKETESSSETTKETASETTSETTTETASESTSESSSSATTETATETATETVTESSSETTTETTTETTVETASQAETSSAAQTAASQESTEASSQAETAAETPSAAAAVSNHGGAVADYAVQFVGNPYVYGGTSLTNGADCSGFVMSVYENFGVSLPHSSTADRNVGVDVGGLENAQPGDLVCYTGHVGIYIGDGQIVHASTASTGIKISEADYRTPVAVRRVLH